MYIHRTINHLRITQVINEKMTAFHLAIMAMHIFGYVYFDTWDSFLSLRRIPKYALWEFAGSVYVTLKIIPYFIYPQENRHQVYNVISTLHMSWIISSHAYRCVNDPRYKFRHIVYKTLYLIGILIQDSNKSNENCDILAFYILGYCLDSIITFYTIASYSTLMVTISSYISLVFPLFILKQTLFLKEYIFLNLIMSGLFAMSLK